MFDGSLSRTTQALVFTLPPHPFPLTFTNDLMLRLALAADRVSGSIISNQSGPSSFSPNPGLPFVAVLISKSIAYTSIYYARGDATPVETAGSVSTDSRVTGAFDGYLAAEYINPAARRPAAFILLPVLVGIKAARFARPFQASALTPTACRSRQALAAGRLTPRSTGSSRRRLEPR